MTTASAASAEEVTCRGTIGIMTGDNARVHVGASCRLVGTTVEGSIRAEGASAPG